MQESTKNAYKSLFQNFVETRLNGQPPSPKRLEDALKSCAHEYRPGYWRKLRNAIVFAQREAGYTETAERISNVKNPITAMSKRGQIGAPEVKKKQIRARSVDEKTHEKIISAVHEKGDRGLLACTTLAKITGARPAEFCGIKVLENNQVFIPSVKKRGDRGLDRVLEFSEKDCLAIQKCVNYLTRAGGNRAVGAAQRRLHSLSKKLFPRRKAAVSLYSYRHQLGSDLKGQGMGRQEIAAVMGHQSVESSDQYGHPQKGGSKRSVRPTQKTVSGVRKTEKSNPISGITKSYSASETANVLANIPEFSPSGPRPKF